MKEFFRVIGKIVFWPFEHYIEIIFVSMILIVPTLVELRIFNIPEDYATGIWLTNTIIAIIVFLYARKSSADKYKEIIKNLERGYPSKEEFIQYEKELKQIGEKFKGEEAFKRQREFIVRKRMENTLKRINLN